MYQHPSIINPVRVYITNIIYLSRLQPWVIILSKTLIFKFILNKLFKKQTKGFNITSNAEDTLSRFCKWQDKFTDLRMNKPDAAILITK